LCQHGRIVLPWAHQVSFEGRPDCLVDVAPQNGDLFSQALASAAIGAGFFGQSLELHSPRDERREVEAESHLDLARAIPSRVALAVRAVPADHEARSDERTQVTPQGRRRHTMGAEPEFTIRGKHDQVGTGREGRLGMKADERPEHSESPVQNSQLSLGFRDRPKAAPLMRDGVGGAPIGERLRGH